MDRSELCIRWGRIYGPSFDDRMLASVPTDSASLAMVTVRTFFYRRFIRGVGGDRGVYEEKIHGEGRESQAEAGEG